jgi:hypothetical protein
MSIQELAKKFKVKESSVERYLRNGKLISDKVENKIFTVVNSPKILLLDIETLPAETLVWGLYKQVIPTENLIKDWSIVGWSAKWLGTSKVMSEILTPEEAINRNDKRILENLWLLMDDAQILIGHNCIKFDIRKTNARFLQHDFAPPKPYKVVDTYTETRKNFAFVSNKLDYLNSMLGLTRKIKTEYGLWRRCLGMDGADANKALSEMEKYNRQDIIALEDLYLILRPWIKGHPNLAIYMDIEDSICPNCGDTNLIEDGNYFTPSGRYKAFRCEGCGAIGRSKTNELTKEQRKSMILPAR